MGVSTNAEINYGIVFEEDFEFPWSDEKYEGDIGEWWLDANGYKPPFEPYTKDGNYAPGFKEKDPRLDEYYEHLRKWMAANPIGVELVNYCSGDCPMHMLAIVGLGMVANRGYPTLIDPSKLAVDEAAIDKLMAFCAKWGIETDGKPGWYLTSYWG